MTTNEEAQKTIVTAMARMAVKSNLFLASDSPVITVIVASIR
jgi:hypothetical protein